MTSAETLPSRIATVLLWLCSGFARLWRFMTGTGVLIPFAFFLLRFRRRATRLVRSCLREQEVASVLPRARRNPRAPILLVPPFEKGDYPCWTFAAALSPSAGRLKILHSWKAWPGYRGP